jgi:hypothetical protein
MTLALRRAAPDDYDVIQAGEIVGRIYGMKADQSGNEFAPSKVNAHLAVLCREPYEKKIAQPKP